MTVMILEAAPAFGWALCQADWDGGVEGSQPAVERGALLVGCEHNTLMCVVRVCISLGEVSEPCLCFRGPLQGEVGKPWISQGPYGGGYL